MSFSLLNGFVKIFATKEYAAKLELLSLNIKTFLGCFVQSERAPSRKMTKVLKAEKGGRKTENFVLNFAITDPSLFRESGSKQVR